MTAPRTPALLLLLFAVSALAPAPGAAAGTSPVSERLAAVLDAEAPERGEPHRIWVRFAPRDLAGEELARALSEAERRIPPARLARRRALGTPPGPADLPVAPARLEDVAATGARLLHVSRWLNAASFLATRGQIEAIAALPHVAEIDPVARLRRPPAPDADPDLVDGAVRRAEAFAGAKTPAAVRYGASYDMLNQINLVALHDLGLTGDGVTVAVFDTGFDLSHSSLTNVDVAAAWDFVDGDPIVEDGRNDPVDGDFHGTEILGILAGRAEGNLIGAAPGATLLLAKTEDVEDETEVEEDNWIAAAEWAVGLGADVISSSVGYYLWYSWDQMDGVTARISVAADMAVSRGTAVVVGVGDQRYDPEWPHPLAPADAFDVITVGGADHNGYLTATTSPGPTRDGRTKPDVLARSIAGVCPYPGHPAIFYFRSGNDRAVPLVAGLVALLLERDPYLTPLQVREALRETASRSLLPDNDYGWGMADGLAAASYWRPLVRHQPLTDLPAEADDVVITAAVLSGAPLTEGSPALYHRVNGGAWRKTIMTPAGGDAWEAPLTGLQADRQVEYYFTATNGNGQTTILPGEGPDAPYSFATTGDRLPPEIGHNPLTDLRPEDWPPRIAAEVADDHGVSSVRMTYSLNGAGLGTVDLAPQAGRWETDFPLPAGSMQPGFRMGYTLIASDTAPVPNVTVLGPFEFDVVEDLGKVLLIGDRPPGDKDAAPAATGIEGMASLLAEAGYVVTLKDADEVKPSDFPGHDVVFYSAGSNYAPLGRVEIRTALQAWTERGGRILVEGGEVAFMSLSQPEYGSFAEDVLHVLGVLAQDGLTMYASPEHLGHPLLTRPNLLPTTLTAYAQGGGMNFGASDVVAPTADATTVMHTGYGMRYGGLVVYDSDTGPRGGQTVFLPIAVDYLPADLRRDLVLNSLHYLTARETAGPTTVSGRVTVSGLGDFAGASVTAGGYTVETDGEGRFTLEGLWGGTYEVTATLPGHSTARTLLELAEGEARTGVDFHLVPVREYAGSTVPNLGIPDNSPPGVSSGILIPVSGAVMDLSVGVDIAHYAVGNLVVELTNPAGSTVTLHNRSGGSTDDLVGTWPDPLWVDGPGSLEDFAMEEAGGVWTLTVRDLALGGVGVLRGWSLSLVIADDVAAAPDPGPGPTRLLGNTPNPFNPRTTVSFDLARPGRVRLEVFDVRGRRLATLADRAFAAGRHALVWEDRQAPSGVYFARLSTPAGMSIHKMTLVR